MVLKRVIPCLDVDKGRVVKGTEFVDIRDAGDPVELAQRYESEGADELVFLDITASHERRDTIVELARRCADDVFIPFTIGGGVRSVVDAQALLAEMAAVFGSQCVVLAIDARRRADDGYEVFVNGGRRPTGRNAVGWAREGVGRGSRATWSTRSSAAVPTPFCAPRSSTTAATRSARPRRACRPPGSRSGCDRRAARPRPRVARHGAPAARARGPAAGLPGRRGGPRSAAGRVGRRPGRRGGGRRGVDCP